MTYFVKIDWYSTFYVQLEKCLYHCNIEQKPSQIHCPSNWLFSVMVALTIVRYALLLCRLSIKPRCLLYFLFSSVISFRASTCIFLLRYILSVYIPNGSLISRFNQSITVFCFLIAIAVKHGEICPPLMSSVINCDGVYMYIIENPGACFTKHT